jgi:predicted ATPase
MEKLNSLYISYTSNPRRPRAASAAAAPAPAESSSSSGFGFGSFFGGGSRKTTPAPAASAPAADDLEHTPEPSSKGLYLWGGVGSGKTMLMDLFYEVVPERLKVRRHFHSFMLDIHARLHKLRQKSGTRRAPVACAARRGAARHKRTGGRPMLRARVHVSWPCAELCCCRRYGG